MGHSHRQPGPAGNSRQHRSNIKTLNTIGVFTPQWLAGSATSHLGTGRFLIVFNIILPLTLVSMFALTHLYFGLSVPLPLLNNIDCLDVRLRAYQPLVNIEIDRPPPPKLGANKLSNQQKNLINPHDVLRIDRFRPTPDRSQVHSDPEPTADVDPFRRMQVSKF
jgi:hypothetical protein